MCNDWLNFSNFLLRAIPKSNYTHTNMSNWLDPLKDVLSISGIEVLFLSSDFAAEHQSYFAIQFEHICGTNSLSSLPFLLVDLERLSEILIPIPDIRHWQRNACNQLIGPKTICCWELLLLFQ